MNELKSAAISAPPAPATVIILAAAIMDVMLREPSGYPASADGVDIAEARDSRDAIGSESAEMASSIMKVGEAALWGQKRFYLRKMPLGQLIRL